MHKIGIIGFGNMGQAIAEQLKTDHEIFCFDKEKVKTNNFGGVEVTATIPELLDKSEVVILAVKPKDFEHLLKEIRSYPHLLDKIFISIAAGISTHYIEKALGVVRLIRVMPNLAVKIGEGVSCLCHGKYATVEDFDLAESLFRYMGQTLIIEENKMDAATAISGSGPAFYFDIVEANYDIYKKNTEQILKEFILSLMEAAEDVGFSHDEAVILTAGTGTAAQHLINKTKLPLAELKRQVTSKGGTTEAGLDVLHKTESLLEAVRAAKKRATELSKLA